MNREEFIEKNSLRDLKQKNSLRDLKQSSCLSKDFRPMPQKKSALIRTVQKSIRATKKSNEDIVAAGHCG
jgi:hypothetical protein